MLETPASSVEEDRYDDAPLLEKLLIQQAAL
jgi:hypothetical protein